MSSIKEKLREIKDTEPKRLETALTALIIVLTGTLGFGIGKMSQMDAENSSIRIEQVPMFQNTNTASVAAVSQSVETVPQQGALVGSKNSDKYHYPWCSGAKRISDANKIFFNSVEEARSAGYSPAGNCPGLE
ncbi:MAG: hypothetical protein COV34_01525 [Candidatus Zambryskibacteria bacterium CG10_big_fil_rev_8_21_14_0_10_42_12]|uniref:Ada DNA repair metal-binding domain-containing protein n=1 Tax=Candidatus Zambryskibacteria bacterium CG10_big_fil_rev_8_21_14_0_10_42_12 TaxID=1975115 RepID=A0A2H0QVF4_9BACT|nr:MAG: hypothetical protein COV34_01525 [Candidatus Zambryskibacteria bacterium CG10_big_fil_rev_8_21_14_0_10_42_12]